ncbi:DUF883 family protein [Paraburkholderia strydomiana]|uniref:DUF883 family protein n=1 Tax=Paraburkholderia strydomiana TaxID=1245417 RepID=UPI002860ECAE|nr:DUF883 domain-containing protein [Paraburkholderia strydomiana]MDR7008828.1 ElaB/YqjD/DUF883 family membrane-anchored ribosome-binding protein [Paraburkholderia strydomiana]
MTESHQPTALAAVPQPVASDRSGGPESSPQRNDAQTSAGRLSDLKDKIACAQEAVRTKYRVVSESTDDYVHEAPWKAVTMALIGGLIIGMLASR